MIRRALAAATLAALVVPASAGAVSRKVGIGNFQWSTREVTVDRGDSVTWFWTGPDTQHSITGLSQNAFGLDSDPGNGAPFHAPGDRFTLHFDQPGVYEFHCKLHAIVRGEVIVSDTPGTGAPSPDPDPQVAVDYQPPELTEARFATPVMRAGQGSELRYTLDEPARITFDVMRGRRLVGTRRFSGHIGWNTWDFGAHLHGRRLAPGRYRALMVAVDSGNNHSGDVAVPFRVKR